MILHADSQPQPGWPGAVIAHLNGATGSAGYFDLAFDDPSRAARFVAGWANLRSRLFALPYGDQGLLAPRALLCEVGVPEIPLMEDVALARALGRRRLRPIGHRIETSAEAYRRDGWVTRGAGNLWRLAQFLGGAAPERLAERYRRR
ncbi:MAG: glycosyl transferase [Pseudomonadota bacterium]